MALQQLAVTDMDKLGKRLNHVSQNYANTRTPGPLRGPSTKASRHICIDQQGKKMKCMKLKYTYSTCTCSICTYSTCKSSACKYSTCAYTQHTYTQQWSIHTAHAHRHEQTKTHVAALDLLAITDMHTHTERHLIITFNFPFVWVSFHKCLFPFVIISLHKCLFALVWVSFHRCKWKEICW